MPPRAPRAALLLGVLAISNVARAQFVPDDLEVCPATAGVYDPEFDSDVQRMVYYDERRRLKVAPVRPDGTIVTRDCRGVVIDVRASTSVPNYPLKNGPEWAVSSRGHEIFYTRLNRDGGVGMARAWYDGAWQTEWVAEGEQRGLALPSVDATDPDPRLLYVHSLPDGTYELQWREASDPATEVTFDATIGVDTASSPRWVPGRRAISTTLEDANGVMQAALYDIDADQYEILTTDAGDKEEAWLWQAPEYGGEYLLLTIVDQSTVRVYRELAGDWTAIFSLAANTFSSRPFIFSPEILTYGERSYVLMQLAGHKVGPGEIWMATIDPVAPDVVMLSDPAELDRVRLEPEWMVTPEGVFVYYMQAQFPQLRQLALHRLTTPL
jgi:hypothetical protein